MKQPFSHAVSSHFTDLHSHFTSLLPRIELHGRIYFRHLRCQHQKDDAIQEMRALAWKWFLRLQECGKDPQDFIKSFTTLLARAVNSGRRLVGMEKCKDAMNHATQRRDGFSVEALPHSHRISHDQLHSNNGQRRQDTVEERLRDNTVTPIPDQVQFRLDWSAWIATLTGIERRLIGAMADGERTKDISQRFELSPGRISQLRREFHSDWTRFCGESV